MKVRRGPPAERECQVHEHPAGQHKGEEVAGLLRQETVRVPGLLVPLVDPALLAADRRFNDVVPFENHIDRHGVVVGLPTGQTFTRLQRLDRQRVHHSGRQPARGTLSHSTVQPHSPAPQLSGRLAEREREVLSHQGRVALLGLAVAPARLPTARHPRRVELPDGVNPETSLRHPQAREPSANGQRPHTSGRQPRDEPATPARP